MGDIRLGLAWGAAHGWFEAGPNDSFRLTTSGFDEIEKLPDVNDDDWIRPQPVSKRQAGRFMAKLPTGEKNGRLALRVFEEHQLRPGENLTKNQVSIWGRANHVRTEDIKAGLLWGDSKGWFEAGPNESFRLTAAGFEEVGKGRPTEYLAD